MVVGQQFKEKHIILLIGFGQIGFRHLQGFLKVKNKLNIYITDNNPNSFEKIASLTIENNHKIQYSTNYIPIKEEIDFCLVASTADKRAVILSEISKLYNIKNLLLEKILFQNIEDFQSTKEFLNSKNINVWINHPRRMYPFYQKVKSLIKKTKVKSIQLSVVGNDWGLACNSIHFIDLLMYLMDTSLTKIESKKLDQKIIESKRPGYIEFTGQLSAVFSCGSILELISRNGKNEPLKIILQSPTLKIEIQEGENGFLKIYLNNILIESIVLNSIYQSDLSTIVVDNIIKKKKITLPKFKDSVLAHELYISEFLIFYNSLLNKQISSLPIT